MPSTSQRAELRNGLRIIRRVTPPDAPWPAALVRDDEDVPGLLVDAALLRDWDGWDASPTGHVLGPRDVIRRGGGHDVLFTLCTEPVATLLSRRGADLALSAGETVTLAVSLLRGLAEIAARDREPAVGRWWLTDDGRPVFVDDPGGERADAAAIDLLDRLAMGTTPALSRALAHAATTAAQPRTMQHEIGDAEASLFDVADPEPLATAPLATVRRRGAVADAEPIDPMAQQRSWWSTVLASVDADLADTFSKASTGLWRRLRRPAQRSRRRTWAIAGSLGAGVVAVGLMWPAPGGPAAAEPQPSASRPVSASGAVDQSTSASPSPQSAGQASAAAGQTTAPTSADLAATTGALLDRRSACLATGSDACLAEVLEDPGRAIPAGAVDAAAAARTVTLLDEFGGAAVLRVASTNAPVPQLVVIVDVDGRWMLRDVHDVGQQP